MRISLFFLVFLIFESAFASSYYYRVKKTLEIAKNVNGRKVSCGILRAGATARKTGRCLNGWCQVVTPSGSCGGWGQIYVGLRGENAIRHRYAKRRTTASSASSPQVMTTASSQPRYVRTGSSPSRPGAELSSNTFNRTAPDLHVPALHRPSRARKFVNYCKRSGISENYCSQVTYPTLGSRGTFNRTYRGQPFLLIPPESHWAKAVSLLSVIQQAGGCIKEIRNWYRPEPYNSRVDGKSSSSHIDASAIDVHYCSLAEKYKALRKFRHMRAKQGRPAGIGTYGSGSFTIHLDLRPKTYGSDVTR